MKFRILSLLTFVCVAFFTSCKQEDPQLQAKGVEVATSDSLERTTPVEIALETTLGGDPEADDLKALNYSYDGSSNFPAIAHTEAEIDVHCYFRSTDPAQPKVYRKLRWKRDKDPQGKLLTTITYRGVVNLPAEADMTKGEWYVSGIIASQVGADGTVNLRRGYFENLTAIATSSKALALDVPFRFPWTRLNTSAKAEAIKVEFNPVGTLIRLQLDNQGKTSYQVEGIDIYSPLMHQPEAITIDDINASPLVSGGYPPVRRLQVLTTSTLTERTSTSISTSFVLAPKSKSPVLLLWLLGAEEDGDKQPMRVYMRVKAKSEFGQEYQKRILIHDDDTRYRMGTRYSLTPVVMDEVGSLLQYFGEFNLSANSIEQSALSHASADNGFYDYITANTLYNEYISPVDPKWRINTPNLGQWIMALPSLDIDFTQPATISSRDVVEFPTSQGLASGPSTFVIANTGVMYAKRFTSGNAVGTYRAVSTAYRYEWIDNPYGPGKALEIKARESNTTMEVITNEAFWRNRPSRNTVRIFPALGVKENGVLVGAGQEVVFITEAGSEFIPGTTFSRPAFKLIRISSNGIKTESLQPGVTYTMSPRLVHGPTSVESVAIGD